MIDVLKVKKKTLFKEFYRIAEENKVKLNIKPIYGGYCNPLTNTIVVGSEGEKNRLPHTFFHELGHVHCRRNKIWKAYHNPSSPQTEEEFKKFWRAYKLTALKAEKWIDLWAEQEVKKYFKNVEIFKVYHMYYGAKVLREEIKQMETSWK